MADGMDAYMASLKLAQGPQSYSEGAHVAATIQQINQEAQARAFQGTMDIIAGNDRRTQQAVEQDLGQQRIDAGLQEAADRRDIMKSHYAEMLAGKGGQALPADPNDPFSNGGGGYAPQGSQMPSAPPADGTGAPQPTMAPGSPGTMAYMQQQSALSPAPAGTNTDDFSSYAPGTAPSPATAKPMAGPLIPGGQSAPDPEAPDAPWNQRGAPMTQPASGEVADGGGLLPLPGDQPAAPAAPTGAATQAPAVAMGSPHPSIPQAKMGGDGKWWMGPTSKFSDVPGPDGSDSTQRVWETRNAKTGQFGISHVETFKGKPTQDSKVPWTEDDQGRKLVDGVEVEPTAGRTLANGVKIWDYKAVGKQPFTPDPADPTKGVIKGAGGQDIPVKVDGINQGADGKLSYRFKTSTGADISSPVSGDFLQNIKDKQAAMVKAGFAPPKEWIQGKDGQPVPKPGITLATDPKASDNSIGALQKNMGPVAKKESDSQFLAMSIPSAEDKQKWITDHKGNTNDPKAWSDAYNAVTADAAGKLADVLNAHNYGKPGFVPLSPQKLLRYRTGSADDAVPPQIAQAPTAAPSPSPSPAVASAPAATPAAPAANPQADAMAKVYKMLGRQAPAAPAPAMATQ